MEPVLWRFSAAGMQVYPRTEAAGGRKAPRHEVAGGLAPAWPRALWGFNAGAELGDGCDVGRMRSADLHTETGNGRLTSGQALGANQRAQGASSATT